MSASILLVYVTRECACDEQEARAVKLRGAVWSNPEWVELILWSSY